MAGPREGTFDTLSRAYLDVRWLFLQDEIGDPFRNLQKEKAKTNQSKQLRRDLLTTNARITSNDKRARLLQTLPSGARGVHVHFILLIKLRSKDF